MAVAVNLTPTYPLALGGTVCEQLDMIGSKKILRLCLVKHYNLDLKLPEKFAMLSLWDALIDGDIASYERILASLRNDANLLGQMKRVRSPFERALSFSADTAGAVDEPVDLKRRLRLADARP
jgi:hypothetical protein